jgi:hypothetical protein
MLIEIDCIAYSVRKTRSIPVHTSKKKLSLAGSKGKEMRAIARAPAFQNRLFRLFQRLLHALERPSHLPSAAMVLRVRGLTLSPSM